MSQFRDQTRSTYDAVASLYADAFPGTEPEQVIDLAMIEHFASLLPQSAVVLDAGCGAGRMLPVLARPSVAPTGVDLSPAMIRRAQQDHPQFTTSVANLESLPFKDASFHGVFSWYSTIHTEDAELHTVLEEFSRVVVDDGLVLLAFQVGQEMREVGAAFRQHGFDVELHRLHRTREQMQGFAAQHGCELVADMERAPQGREQDPQAVMIFRKFASLSRRGPDAELRASPRG